MRRQRGPVGIGDRLDILSEFKAIIFRAGNRQKDFRLRFRGRGYRATLTSYGRVLVRDSDGAIIIASGLGWVFDVPAVPRRRRRRHGK